MNFPDSLVELLCDPSTTITETVYDAKVSNIEVLTQAIREELAE